MGLEVLAAALTSLAMVTTLSARRLSSFALATVVSMRSYLSSCETMVLKTENKHLWKALLECSIQWDCVRIVAPQQRLPMSRTSAQLAHCNSVLHQKCLLSFVGIIANT